jgi:hypothetical protein
MAPTMPKDTSPEKKDEPPRKEKKRSRIESIILFFQKETKSL